MKKLLLLLLYVPLIGWGQINIGVDQTICFGDAAEVIASIQGGGQGAGVDTVVAGVHSSDYSSSMTRGWWFQAQSSYTISGVHCSDDNTAGTVLGTNQSVEIVDFGINPPLAYPTSTGSHTTLFSAIDTAEGWIVCNVNIVSGNYYGIIGAKHAPVVIGPIIPVPTMYNSYGPSGSQTFTIDGHPTTVTRLLLQSALCMGPPVAGSYMSEASGQIGRVDIVTGGGVNWYDVNSGQMIGDGDTLHYTPSQSTYVVGVITDSSGQIWSDTMYIEVLNTNISTTGFSLCNGSVVLTAPSSFSTYSWSNGASTNSVLTVNTPGTYYVDCMTSNGLSCQSDPVTIYAGVIPITLSTPDSVFICQGDTVVMDGPLGFSSYSWSTGATTSSISTTSTGNYSLSVVDGNGCTGTSNTTSVSISPSTITATTTGYAICTGNLSVTLDAGSGFGSYQWYNNGAMMPNTSQTLVATVAGNYTVDVTYPTGCIATSNTITVYNATLQSPFYFFINTIGNDSLCLPNGQVTLDAGNYSTFNWSTGETSPQISVNTLGGSYSVNVTDLNGCPGVSNPPFTVYSIVNTSVISGPINPTQFQTVTYSVNPTSGSTYNWTLFGGTIESGQGTNSIDVKWTNSGMFTFSVLETDVNGCVGEEVTLLVNIIFNSVEDINSTTGTLTKITDVLGRESKEKSNVPLFYIFDNGTVKKKIIVE